MCLNLPFEHGPKPWTTTLAAAPVRGGRGLDAAHVEPRRRPPRTALRPPPPRPNTRVPRPDAPLAVARQTGRRGARGDVRGPLRQSRRTRGRRLATVRLRACGGVVPRGVDGLGTATTARRVTRHVRVPLAGCRHRPHADGIDPQPCRALVARARFGGEMDTGSGGAVEVAPFHSGGSLKGFVVSGRWPDSTKEWAQLLMVAVRVASLPGLLATTTIFGVRE